MITLAMAMMVVGVSTTLAAVDRSQKDRQAREALEKDKAVTELSFLKNQINPHFYFNTLNNIYVLTELDPKLAGEAILQLSKMMRYLLYDTQRENTLLSQEIAFVKNYIGLMKLRLTDRVKIEVDTPEDLEDMPLAPLILLPFVENAFKHGVSATQPSQISISIDQIGKTIEMTVRNRIMNDHSLSLDTDSGIGLANTRRRLDLLYPNKHTLTIDERDADDLYSVHLNLDLS
jgi:two-component system LytT family sensor kinase